MTYTVKYKGTKDLFWKTIRNVKGDGFIDESAGIYSHVPGTDIPTFVRKTANTGRWFILQDDSRIEVPTDNMMFSFSKERYTMILESIKNESGR